MRSWEFRIVIEEGHDEFWEGRADSDVTAEDARGYATCEEVQELLEYALDGIGIFEDQREVKLTRMLNDDG